MFKIRLRKADKLFRKLILQRGNYTCARCHTVYNPNNCRGLHVSHYWGRGRENTRFDEENVCLLCLPCHQSWGHGDGRDEYTEFMKKRLGKQGFEDLMLRAHIHKKRDDVVDELYINELLGGIMNIDKLVLTTEKMQGIVGGIYHKANETEPPKPVLEMDIAEAISLATVKKVLKWMDEPCTEHWKRIIPHRDCVRCQQELCKILEEG